MTEHLPECFASLCECDDTHFKSIDCDFSCICPSLRACEQRVLDAAREAVAALDIGRDVRFSVDVQADALAAIDALKEKP